MRRTGIALAFLSLWAFFMVIIFATVMLTNIDWGRSKFERLMSQSLHRHVRLGHLSLTFGWDGFAISTTGLSISEQNGRAFLNTKRSEIGVALRPLLSGQLKIRHLSFQDPELWAVKTGKNRWNFSDLLQTALDVNSLQSSGGSVHITDQSSDKKTSFAQIELRDFDTKLSRLSKHFDKPILLSFTLLRPTFNSKFWLEGSLSGHTSDWRDNHCKLALKTSNINKEQLEAAQSLLNVDLRPILDTLKENTIGGLFTLSATIKGTINSKFKADVALEASNFTCTVSKIGTLTTPKINMHGDLSANRNELSWRNSNIVIDDASAHVRTEGTLRNWRSKGNCICSGTIVAVLSNLGSLAEDLSLHNPNSPDQELSLNGLGGKALLDSHFKISPDGTSYDNYIKVSDLRVKGATDFFPKSVVAVLTGLNLNDQASLSGDISIDAKNKVKFDNCVLETGSTKYKLSGISDSNENMLKFNLSANDVDLSDLSTGMKNPDSIGSNLLKSFCPGSDETVRLSGKANFSCLYEQAGKKSQMNADVSLDGARLVATSPYTCLEKMSGKLEIRPNLLKFKNVAGVMGSGHILLTGVLPSAPSDKINLQFQATHFNLENLNSLLHLLHTDLPLLETHQLTGLVRDLKIDIRGTRSRPLVSLIATPENLYYCPPGSPMPLRAIAGSIIYDNDELILRDALFTLETGNVLADLSLKQLSTTPFCERLRLKTAGIDLKEAEPLLCSSLAPQVVNSYYEQFKHEHQLVSIHGKIQGDVVYRAEGSNNNLTGQVQLTNVGLKAGPHQLQLERITGPLIFTDDAIRAQNLSCSTHNSTFNLDAVFPKQTKSSKHWQLDLKTQVNPVDLGEILTILSPQTNLLPTSFSARLPIAVHAKCEGHSDSSTINLSVASPHDGALTFKLPLGIFHQPTGEPLLFEGILKQSGPLFAISDSRLTIGQDVLQCKGQFHNDRSDDYDLTLKAAKFLSLKTLRELVEPSLFETVVDGRIKGAMTILANGGKLLLRGATTFDNVSLPQFELKDLSGDFVCPAPDSRSTANGSGRLQLKDLRLGSVTINNFTANLEWFTTDSYKRQPTIKISHCNGSFAGGNLYGNGLIKSDAHSFSVHAYLSKASAARLMEEMFGLEGELTGVLDGEIDLASSGASEADVTANMLGRGSVNIRNGSITRFGRLQEKLNHVNLLHQGLFGFNLNNLLQSVVPVRTGDYKLLTSSWRLARGKLLIEELRYNGDDMRLWAAGEANLPLHTLELEIAGQIPRVASSVLSGTVGGLSKDITVQKFMGSITRHKLEVLPSLPILGDIASSKPRVFTFRVLAPYDEPKTLSQSIEKSFHWLPSKPNATAHPVFGPQFN
jgi:hypothetical protein